MEFVNICPKTTPGIKTFFRYRELVEKVAFCFQQNLLYDFFFKQKLSLLTVTIGLTNEPLTIGEYSQRAKDFRPELKIKFSINEANPNDFIAFTIAQIFAYLLLDNYGLQHHVFTEEDTSYKVTAIIRMRKDSDSLYGENFQNQIVDLIALFILKKLSMTQRSSLLKSELAKTQQLRSYTSEFINIFGNSLNSGLTYLEGLQETDGEPEVKNIFWFLLITNQLEKIIYAYEQLMGKNSWEHLLVLYDTSSNKKSLNMIQSEIKRYKYYANLDE